MSPSNTKLERAKRVWQSVQHEHAKHYGHSTRRSVRDMLNGAMEISRRFPRTPRDFLDPKYYADPLSKWGVLNQAWRREQLEKKEAERTAHAVSKRAMADPVFRETWLVQCVKRLRVLSKPPKLKIEAQHAWHVAKEERNAEIAGILTDLDFAGVKGYTAWMQERMRKCQVALSGVTVAWGKAMDSKTAPGRSFIWRSLKINKFYGLDTRYQWELSPGYALEITEDRARSHGNRGRWRQKARHEAKICSFAMVEDKERTLAVMFLDTVRRAPVPEGYKMFQGRHGWGLVLRRISDAADYHPDAGEIFDLDFTSMIANLERNVARRQLEVFDHPLTSPLRPYFLADLDGLYPPRVHWDDSIKAGNCERGTRVVAHAMGLPEDLVGFNGPGVSAAELTRWGKQNQDDDIALDASLGRVEAACWHAWQRETLVCI